MHSFMYKFMDKFPIIPKHLNKIQIWNKINFGEFVVSHLNLILFYHLEFGPNCL